jgi:hypothetical protein
LVRLLIIAFAIFFSIALHAQENNSAIDKIANFPSKFIDRINKKASSLESDLEHQTEKYLHRLQKKEAKLKRKLSRIDSAGAARIFSADAEYAQLMRRMESPLQGSPNGGGVATRGEYMAGIDSLSGSLSFLSQNSQLISDNKELQDKLGSSLSEVKDLQTKLADADDVKAFIRQRKEQIKAELSQYTNLPSSITNSYNDYTKELYYYTQQIKEYKDILNDPDKLTQKALSLLNKLPAFQQFMKQYGQLAGLFGVPANYGSPQAVAGLQTRDQVQQLIQNQLASGGPNAQAMLTQNLQAAQAQLGQLKDKISKLGQGGADIDMPNFKPNNQRTKSFWKRLEYGTNLQTAHGNYFYPTTTDMGLTVGYKLNNNSTIGIGGSYKMGWGQDIQHIALSSQGASLKSYLDMKLKGSFYASGGFEYNYQPLAVSIANSIGTTTTTQAPPLSGRLPNFQSWQQSGLIGLSKIISVKTKFFKKTRLQLLWDFLSYEQVPKAQPIKFRVGYNF